MTIVFRKNAADKTNLCSSDEVWFTYLISEVFTSVCLITSTKEVTTRKRDHTPSSVLLSALCARIIVLKTPKIGMESFCIPLKKAANSQLSFFDVDFIFVRKIDSFKLEVPMRFHIPAALL